MKKILFLWLLFVSVKAQTVRKLEYFIDNDPGTGAATNVPITAAGTVNKTFTFNVSSLSDGIHLISVRSQDQNFFWSIPQTKAFYKETITAPPALANVVKLEYFIDNDPGQNAATNVPITAGTSINNQAFSFNVSSLSDGIHLISLRARDAKKFWSIVQTKAFYKETITAPPTLANIVKLEYFIDNDPGTGAGTNVPITAGMSVNNVAFSFNTGALINGPHKLTLRAKDANNRWGIVKINAFTVQDNIIFVGSSPPQWCVNTAFNVPFTITGTYTAGNIFTAQLSDSNGSFTSPTTIGMLTATTAGTISATVPNGTALGNNYQIRVISSTPSITNTDGKSFQLISVCPPPCAGLLTLGHPADDISSGSIIKQASATNGTISASNYVQGNGTRATYQAKSTTLTAGFRADSGTIFKVEVGGCN